VREGRWRPAHRDCLGVGPDVCGRPVTESLDVQRLSARRILICEGNAVQFDAERRGEVDCDTCARGRTGAKVRRVDGVHGREIVDGRETQVNDADLGEVEGVREEFLWTTR
jgi:hypothetical protein